MVLKYTCVLDRFRLDVFVCFVVFFFFYFFYYIYIICYIYYYITMDLYVS